MHESSGDHQVVSIVARDIIILAFRFRLGTYIQSFRRTEAGKQTQERKTPSRARGRLSNLAQYANAMVYPSPLQNMKPKEQEQNHASDGGGAKRAASLTETKEKMQFPSDRTVLVIYKASPYYTQVTGKPAVVVR